MDVDEPSSTWSEFRADLVSALRVWRRHPVLPLLSVVLTSGYLLIPGRSPLGVLVLPVVVFSVGWPGMERVWYLRAFRDESVTASDVWTITRPRRGAWRGLSPRLR